ncbi:MAG: PLDc N-terminal domain-containing protein [Bowdeniella nasicola]|nr:PLDc N-terminal domain-containing protein [Bowdeniella nasicola]
MIIFFIGLAVSLFALVRLVQSSDERIGGLSRTAWLFIILLAGTLGAIVFLVVSSRQRSANYSHPYDAPEWHAPLDEQHSVQTPPRDRDHEANPPRYGQRRVDPPQYGERRSDDDDSGGLYRY